MGSLNVFRVFGAATCLATFLATPAAQAGPTFSIGDGTSTTWTQAINSGQVAPATTISNAETAYYTQAVGAGNFTYASPVLTPDFALPDSTAMVMSWSPPPSTPSGTLVVSAWDYNYGLDPDLTNTLLLMKATTTAVVYDISIVLIDSNGNWSSYHLNDPAPGSNLYAINPAVGDQNGFVNNRDSNFDLTHVTSIEIDDSAVDQTYYSPPLQLDPTGEGLFYSGFQSLAVVMVPEPSSLTLTGLAALMGIGYVRFRRRRVA